MAGEASDDRADALIEEGHGCGAVDEIGEGLNQFLPQSGLQRSQHAKLQN